MNKECQVKQMYEKYPFPNDNIINNHGWILKSLPEPIKRGSKILDAGCGTGEISFFLSKFGAVTGIDFSENSIEQAEKLKQKLNLNIRFIIDDLTKLQHKKKYDYIFCIGVLHHIPKRDLAIENLKTIMHKNSFLIISVYNKYGLFFPNLFKQKQKNKAREIDAYYHPYAVYYSQKQFSKILAEHNLRIIKIWRNIPEFLRLVTGRGGVMSFCCKLK